MTTDFQAKVRQFHELMGVAVNDTPTMLDANTRTLRCKLLLEETLEFIAASGCVVVHMGDGRMGVESMPDATHPNLLAMAQELSDVQYVTSGAAVTFGLPLEALFEEVHAANMRKVGPDGKVLKRPDGKVVKPAGWRGPDIAAVLDKAK